MSGGDTLLGWLRAAKAAHLLGAFTRLGLPDLLGAGTGTTEALAQACGIPPRLLTRLLRGCAEIGLCAERTPRAFLLTETGSLLCQGNTLRDAVLLSTDPATESAWAHFEQGLRSGRGGFHEAFGTSIFEYMDGDPELRALYDRFMARHTTVVAEEIVAHHDFGRYATVTDVGGGDGTLLAAIQRRHPELHATVYDRADGDFLRSVPPGGQLYLLKWILHDWDDEHAVTILRNCREAMGDNGTVLIVERMLSEPESPGTPRDPDLGDLHMLTIYGGAERTRGEYGELLARAGLRATEVTPLPSGLALIEAAGQQPHP